MQYTVHVFCGEFDLFCIELNDMVIVNWAELMTSDNRHHVPTCEAMPFIVPAWQHAILSWRSGPNGWAPPPDEDDFQAIHDALCSHTGALHVIETRYWPPFIGDPNLPHPTRVTKEPEAHTVDGK